MSYLMQLPELWHFSGEMDGYPLLKVVMRLFVCDISIRRLIYCMEKKLNCMLAKNKI